MIYTALFSVEPTYYEEYYNPVFLSRPKLREHIVLLLSAAASALHAQDNFPWMDSKVYFFHVSYSAAKSRIRQTSLGISRTMGNSILMLYVNFNFYIP